VEPDRRDSITRRKNAPIRVRLPTIGDEAAPGNRTRAR
jgi:hypothetical protein